MVLVYRQDMLKQTAPPVKEIVERKNTRVETYRADVERLEVMWFDVKITLVQMTKITHWRSVSQISKVARRKLNLPNRFTIRKGYND